MALIRQQTLGDRANFKCITDNSDPARILWIQKRSISLEIMLRILCFGL